MPGYDIGDDLQRSGRTAVYIMEAYCKVNEDGGTDRYQRVGTQARGTLPYLAFEADDGAEYKGDAQAGE